MAQVSGTFTGTGPSAEIAAIHGNGIVAIDATFAGAATVAVEWTVDGNNWRPVESFTASFQKVFEAPGIAVRLNCTEHTADVAYAMATR